MLLFYQIDPQKALKNDQDCNSFCQACDISSFRRRNSDTKWLRYHTKLFVHVLLRWLIRNTIHAVRQLDCPHQASVEKGDA